MKKEHVFIIICLVVIISVAVIFYLWQDALTLSTGSDYWDRPEITGVMFQTGNATISVMNVGLYTFGISEVLVDNVKKPVLATGGSLTGSGPYDLDPGESATITIGLSWTSGIHYKFEVITTGLMRARASAAAP
jgi:hypothetical protein